MMRALVSLALVTAATTSAAAQSTQPLADQEARIAASETRAALLDRQRRERVQRLATAEAPTAELLAALQRAAVHPPLAALVEPGSIATALQKRAILAATLPALAARTADMHRDVAALDGAEAAARDQLRQARLRLAELVETLRGGTIAQGAGPGERRLLAALPAPALRPESIPSPRVAAPVYRLPLQGRVLLGTGEPIAGGGRGQGVTLAAEAGAPVRAPASGRVGYAGPFGGYGQIVIIDHGHGWTSLLAGLATTRVAPGTSVPGGAILGSMAPIPSRLTLELKRDGRTVDVATIAAWRGS